MAGGTAEEAPSGPKRNVFGEIPGSAIELNLTALMDILSNLLFFLLASFGATIVVAINGSVPVQSADKSDLADTQQTVTVNVKLTKATVEVTALGAAQSPAELDALRRTMAHRDGKPDFAAFSDHLMAIKKQFPKSDTVILTPDPGVSYDLMIQTMDAAREKEVAVEGRRQPLKLFPTVVVSTVVK